MNKRNDAREQIIKPYIQGKKVLDMGAGDDRHRSLHKFIAKYAQQVIGMELDPKRAKNLQKKGYDVRVGNAETSKLKEKFDVVVAGDLIEHLDNPGLFLENVKFHLKKGGTFICNTPNAYSFNFVMRGLFLGGKVKHFYEHTFVFTEQLLRELYQRHGFPITKVTYFNHKTNNMANIMLRVVGTISKKWKENIIIIAKK